MQVPSLEGGYLPSLGAPDKNQRYESQYTSAQSIPTIVDACTGEILQGSDFMHPEGYLVPPPGYSFVECAQPIPTIVDACTGMILQASDFMNPDGYLVPPPGYSFQECNMQNNTAFGSSPLSDPFLPNLSYGEKSLYGFEQQTIRNTRFERSYRSQKPRTQLQNELQTNCLKTWQPASKIPIACADASKESKRILRALQLPEATAEDETPCNAVRIACRTLVRLNKLPKQLSTIVEKLEPTSFEIQITKSGKQLNLYLNLPTLDVDDVYEKVRYLKSLTGLRMHVPKVSKNESRKQILADILKQK